jgi:signal transduction histidine kinase
MKKNELFKGVQDLSNIESSNWNELHVILDDVIHELNQPIGSLGNIVFAFQNLLQSSNTKLEDLKHALANLTEVSNAIGLRLASYRALSSGGQENLNLDVRKIIDESIESLSGVAELNKVNIEFNKAKSQVNNFLVFGNAFQLRIAFRGILLNSIQALSETSILNKKILISVIPTGREIVSIFIRDNGPGVPPEIREKIFERGFTTKSGHGLGLGLPLVSSVISNHGGRVNLSDKTGQGAEFIIEFPLSDSDQMVGGE